MPNLFFRTSIAPYRVDTYNSISRLLNCDMWFMSRQEKSQKLNHKLIESRCEFTPHFLESRRLFGFTFYRGIWKIIETANPRLVIVPEFKFLSWQVLLYKFFKRRKFKVISMCDDSLDMVEGGKDFTYLHRLARYLTVPFLDDLLLVDSKVAQWYQNHYGKGKWMPIIRDERLELPLYQAALHISEELKIKYNLKGKRILLYVGRLVAVKNLHLLLDAIEQTREDFTTVIVGDGELLSELQVHAGSIKKEIVFAGHFEDSFIRAWFNVADVFVLPSIVEPFGAVTNEALLGGCYAIISNVCGSTCLIDKSNGATFNPEDTQDLAEKIDSAISAVGKYNGDIGMNLTFRDSVESVLLSLNNYGKD